MAGHRQGTGKPLRRDARGARARARLSAAQTGEQQAAAAFDLLRLALRGRPDADQHLWELATDLKVRATRLLERAA